MTTGKWTGAYVAEALELVTSTVGVDNFLGAAAAAAATGPQRIVWEWAENEKYYGPAQLRDDEGHVIWDVDQRYDVQIWAEDPRSAVDLHDALLAALDTNFSPNAYRPNKAQPKGEGVADGGYQVLLSITLLRVPIFRSTANPVTITLKTGNVVVTDPLGGTPTPGPNEVVP